MSEIPEHFHKICDEIDDATLEHGNKNWTSYEALMDALHKYQCDVIRHGFTLPSHDERNT